MAESRVPKQVSGFHCERMGGELLLHNPAGTKVLYLNETAALIWQLCDGQRTTDEVRELLRGSFPESDRINVRPCRTNTTTLHRPRRCSVLMPVATRFVGFGCGASIRIDYQGPGTKSLVNFLYRDIPDDQGTASHITFRLRSERGRFRLHCGSALAYDGKSVSGLADALLAETSRHLADNSCDGLVFHAAAVRWKDRCLLLPGKTGAGKTTLTAWLVSRGFSYLTDELVYIAHGSKRVHALTRPLNVKAGGMAVLQPLGLAGHASDLPTGRGAMLVPPDTVAKDKGPRAPRLAAIVFPHYRCGARFRAKPLSRGQAGLALMACLINARNLPENGLTQVADLAKLVPGCRVRYSEFGQIEAWATRLMASGLTELGTNEELL